MNFLVFLVASTKNLPSINSLMRLLGASSVLEEGLLRLQDYIIAGDLVAFHADVHIIAI